LRICPAKEVSMHWAGYIPEMAVILAAIIIIICLRSHKPKAAGPEATPPGEYPPTWEEEGIA